MTTTLMASSGTTTNNNEITEEGTISSDNEITEEGAMPSSSPTSGSNINYEGTTSNDTDMKEGMNSSSNNDDIKEGMISTSNNHDISEDHVTVFVAYNGKWEYDRKEWFFENSKSSIMVVPKHITFSEITDILHKQLDVIKEFYRLKLEVHYRTGSSPLFPVTEIQNDQDLSVFISETSKTKLPLCVSQLDEKFANVVQDKLSSGVDQERRKGPVRVLVAYNGKWRWDGEKWLFENSKGSIMAVSKYVTLSQITKRLYRRWWVDESSYDLKLEVHYRGGSPWFPIIEIEDDEDLSLFISESWKTKLPLCVTRVAKAVVVEGAEHERKGKDDRVEKRLIKAIRKNDWEEAREIVNTREVTWTSKLNESGSTALHFAVGRYENNEVFRDILTGISSELLVTTTDIDGQIPAHTAAMFGNIEALKIMVKSNPKCLFIPNNDSFLPINSALGIPEKRTFTYLFEQMKSYKEEYDMLFSGTPDVAYELINDYPSLATAVYRDKTALECIIRKPELFYSGTSYSFYSRLVYHITPIENNSFGSIDTADVENQETPNKDKFVTKYTRRCQHDVISRICVKLWETALPHVSFFKRIKDNKVKHNTTIKLLRRICQEVDRTNTSSEIERLYSSPFWLAVENDTFEAVDELTTYFEGLYNSKKDGHNIYQLIVLNRSEKVYRYILNHERFVKSGFSISKDNDDNNILHLAGRLAPTHKFISASRAALQFHKELLWFEEMKRVVGITHTRALNKNNETPMMVFRREHKKLRKDGEEWMKKTADSYMITAVLVITIVFAAAITVPGGNDDKTGKPIFERKPSFIIFAVANAISWFTATTSLLLLMSIFTARFADEDFLYKLQTRLINGFVMLFVSVTSLMIAFSATLYMMFGQEKAWILIPIAALTCLPIASFVTIQFPLLVEFISSTYGTGIFGREIY